MLSGALNSEPRTWLSDKLNLELRELGRGGRLSSELRKLNNEGVNSLTLSNSLNLELKTRELVSRNEQRRKGDQKF